MHINFTNPLPSPTNSLQPCWQARNRTPLGRLACISAVLKRRERKMDEQRQTTPFEFQYDAETAFASSNPRGDSFSYLDAQFEMASSIPSRADSALPTYASEDSLTTQGSGTGATQPTVALDHDTNINDTSNCDSYDNRDIEAPNKEPDSPQFSPPSLMTANLLRPWDMLGERTHISKDRKKIRSLSDAERQIRYEVMQIKYGGRVPDITPETPNIKDPLRDVHYAFLSSDGSRRVTAWATREDIRLERALPDNQIAMDFLQPSISSRRRFDVSAEISEDHRNSAHEGSTCHLSPGKHLARFLPYDRRLRSAARTPQGSTDLANEQGPSSRRLRRPTTKYSGRPPDYSEPRLLGSDDDHSRGHTLGSGKARRSKSTASSVSVTRSTPVDAPFSAENELRALTASPVSSTSVNAPAIDHQAIYVWRNKQYKCMWPKDGSIRCRKGFSRLSDLRRHWDACHDKVQSPQCEFCRKVLSRGDALKRHYKTCAEKKEQQRRQQDTEQGE